MIPDGTLTDVAKAILNALTTPLESTQVAETRG
jgi:hypothetical protein